MNNTISTYATIKEIVDQLESCVYKCKGGPLKMNIAFERLKVLAELNYQPKYAINETVYYSGSEHYVFAVRSAPQSHPDCELEYLLSDKPLRQSTTNLSNSSWVREKDLMSEKEFAVKEIEKAREILAKYSKP